MKPLKVMVVPDALNSAVVFEAAATLDSPVGPTSIVTVAVTPLASAICDATVRFQMRS